MANSNIQNKNTIITSEVLNDTLYMKLNQYLILISHCSISLHGFLTVRSDFLGLKAVSTGTSFLT